MTKIVTQPEDLYDIKDENQGREVTASFKSRNQIGTTTNIMSLTFKKKNQPR